MFLNFRNFEVRIRIGEEKLAKEKFREFVLSLGMDDVGFVSAVDFKSPQSPALSGILPGVKILVVMAYNVLDKCKSENKQIAFSGRMGFIGFQYFCFNCMKACPVEGA